MDGVQSPPSSTPRSRPRRDCSSRSRQVLLSAEPLRAATSFATTSHSPTTFGWDLETDTPRPTSPSRAGAVDAWAPGRDTIVPPRRTVAGHAVTSRCHLGIPFSGSRQRLEGRGSIEGLHPRGEARRRCDVLGRPGSPRGCLRVEAVSASSGVTRLTFTRKVVCGKPTPERRSWPPGWNVARDCPHSEIAGRERTCSVQVRPTGCLCARCSSAVGLLPGNLFDRCVLLGDCAPVR
jgi:hypothetical protein